MVELKGMYISKAGLKAQGWTDKAIVTFLPTHDKEAQNPYYHGAAPMKLYLKSRVDDIEKTPAYLQFNEKNINRINGAKNAVDTKRTRLLSEVNNWQIQVKEKSLETQIKNAVRSYNNFHEDISYERGGEFIPADVGADQSFLNRITVNYIRHNMSHYDNKLDRLFGKVGKYDAYIILNKKIYAKISEVYPMFADECKRQLHRKLDELNTPTMADVR